MSGRFFFVVGPSGAGKDSLIDGARSKLPASAFVFARRVITRAPGAAGEDHEACTETEFAARQARGDFLITWEAHGLHYGLPAMLLDALAQGRHVIANGSRAMVAPLFKRLPALVVSEVSAPAYVLAKRLAARGRETASDIARRLERKIPDYPADCHILHVINDQTLEIGVNRFIETVQTHLAAG